MARTNIQSTRIKPEVSELVTARVLRRERISPHVVRVTLGGGTLDRFRPLGFDQWFRLLLPSGGDELTWTPDKLSLLTYARYLTLPKATRPAIRTYTVRAYRPGPELDIDVIVHGAGGGPGAAWAETCEPGSEVGLLDEGLTYTPAAGLAYTVLVAEESGLPAVAGILGSLPPDARGEVVLEIPEEADRQELAAPDGVDVTWVVRTGRPGAAALAALRERPVPTEPFYGWTVGEQQLPTGVRRHWVEAGVPKDRITFCGYWREGRSS
jgi:NADPH-dependent ferric siderophore reductase